MGRRLVSLDWGIKRLLRSKANFEVLEGFLSELLREDVEIEEILEGESNREHANDRQNRVDIKVRRKGGQLVLVEIQFRRELDYFHRILFGVAKAVTEHMESGMPYRDVQKVISVNIIYFDPGDGDDYIYHGTTDFYGLHTKNRLGLSAPFRKYLDRERMPDIFPEYYLLCVHRFNNVAKDTLDEWVYFLKNEEIKPEFTAKGLKAAEQALAIANLPAADRRAYDWYEDLRHREASEACQLKFEIAEAREEGIKKGLQEGIDKGLQEGLQQGIQQGLQQGLQQGIEQGIEKGLAKGVEDGQTLARREIARDLRARGMSREEVMQITGIDLAE